MNDWIIKFKLAIIDEDLDAISRLVDKIENQKFENVQEMQEALALTQEAHKMFLAQKGYLGTEIQKLKSAQKYIW